MLSAIHKKVRVPLAVLLRLVVWTVLLCSASNMRRSGVYGAGFAGFESVVGEFGDAQRPRVVSVVRRFS